MTGLFHETWPPTSSLATHLFPDARQYVTDSKDGARRLAQRGRVTRSSTSIKVGRRGRRDGRPMSTTRAFPVVVDAGRRPPGGTTRVCLLLVNHSRWRPTDTTRWSTEGHDTGVPGGRQRRPMSAEGNDAGVSGARQPQPMETDRHDAVVPSRMSRPPEPPRPPSPQPGDAASSTAGWEGGMRSNRRVRSSPFRLGRWERRRGKCRRVRLPRFRRARREGGGGGLYRRVMPSPLPTGTRGGRGR